MIWWYIVVVLVGFEIRALAGVVARCGFLVCGCGFCDFVTTLVFRYDVVWVVWFVGGGCG